MAAAVGDVGELGHVDVNQRSGMIVFIPPQRFAGDAVDVGQPVDSAPGHSTACTVEAGTSSYPAICTGPSRLPPPDVNDAPYHLLAGLGRADVWSCGRPHPRGAFGAEAIGPFLGGSRCGHE